MVMGYLRSVDDFNKGKKSEFYSRKYFSEKKALDRMKVEDCLSLAAE